MINNNFLKKLLITTATLTMFGAGMNTAIAKPHAKDSKQFHLISDHDSRALFNHGTAAGTTAGTSGLDTDDFAILNAMGIDFSMPDDTSDELNTQTLVTAHAIGGASESTGADAMFLVPGTTAYEQLSYTQVDKVSQLLTSIKTALQDKTNYITHATVTYHLQQLYNQPLGDDARTLGVIPNSLYNELLNKYGKSGLSGDAATLDNYFTQAGITATLGFAVNPSTGDVTQSSSGNAIVTADVQNLNNKLRDLYNALLNQPNGGAQVNALIDQISAITGISTSDKATLINNIKSAFNIYDFQHNTPHFLKVYDLHFDEHSHTLVYQPTGSTTIKTISTAQAAIIDDALQKIKDAQTDLIIKHRDAKWGYDLISGNEPGYKRLLNEDINKLKSAKTSFGGGATGDRLSKIDSLISDLEQAKTQIDTVILDDLSTVPHIVAHADLPRNPYSVSGGPVHRSAPAPATPAKTDDQEIDEILSAVHLICDDIIKNAKESIKRHQNYIDVENKIKAEVKRITDITGGSAPTMTSAMLNNLESAPGTPGSTGGSGSYVPVSTPASHAIDTNLQSDLSANLGITVHGDNVVMTLKDANGNIVTNIDGSPRTISLNYQAAKIANDIVKVHKSAKSNFDTNKKAYDSLKGNIDLNYRNLRQALLSAQATLNNEEGKVPPNTALINGLRSLINAPHTQSIFTAMTVLNRAYKDIESELKTLSTRTTRTARAVSLTMTPAALQSAITMAQAVITASSTPVADFKKAITDYQKALTKLNRLSVAINPLLRPAPVLGNVLSQTIRDIGMLNQYLLQRRSMGNLGLWSYSDMAIIESDAQYRSEYFNDDAMEQGNENFAIGADKTITDLIRAGAFFNYATNKQKSKTLKQDSKSYTVGAYATYKLFPQLYVHDKLSLTMATFNNKNDRGYGIITKSDIDTKSINNEFSIGVNNDDNSLTIETYLNSIYMLSTDFKERETTLAGGQLYNIDANIDATFYNSIGGRVMYLHPEYYTVSYLPDWQFTPYLKSFIDLALTGKELKGDYTQVYVKSNKVKFEDVKSLSYGFTIGQSIKFSTLQALSATISYNLNHYNNTSHSLSVGFNLGL